MRKKWKHAVAKQDCFLKNLSAVASMVMTNNRIPNVQLSGSTRINWRERRSAVSRLSTIISAQTSRCLCKLWPFIWEKLVAHVTKGRIHSLRKVEGNHESIADEWQDWHAMVHGGTVEPKKSRWNVLLFFPSVTAGHLLQNLNYVDSVKFLRMSGCLLL